MLFCEAGRLVPAEGLCQNPQRERNGYKEQAETNRAAPAKPRAPGAPVAHAGLVAPVGSILVVLDTFALVLHKSSLLLDEGPSPSGLDDIPENGARPTHSAVALCVRHVVRRMSSAWLV